MADRTRQRLYPALDDGPFSLRVHRADNEVWINRGDLLAYLGHHFADQIPSTTSDVLWQIMTEVGRSAAK